MGKRPQPTWNLEPNPVHYQLLNIIWTFGCSTADYQRASELLSKRLIDPTPLIEERFSLRDIQKVFEKAYS
jgi:L-iditol 2-dehydrogenase